MFYFSAFPRVVRRFIPVLLLSFALLIRLWGITSVDEAWDEVPVVRYGEIYLETLSKLDFNHESWKLNKEHPPFSKYFYGATRVLSLRIPLFRDRLDQDYPLGRRYTLQRVISALIGSLGVVIVYLFGRKILGREDVGVLAALILALTPYYIAHNRIATQETLVCFLTLLATYLFALGLKSGDFRDRHFLLAGLVLGLGVSTKYNAFLFLALFFFSTLLFFGKKFKKHPQLLVKNYILLVPLIAVSVLVLIWPWLWSNPLSQFLNSLSRIESSRWQEYFLGAFGKQPPHYYFLVYLLATTPPVLLILLSFFVIGLLLSGVGYGAQDKSRNRWRWFILLWFLTPFLASFIALRQDGVRYIFPMYPALSVSAALGLDYFSSWLRRCWSREQVFFAGSLLVLSCLLFTVVRFYPYYLDYYNFLVGGPCGVYERRLFDFGYWGEGIRRATRWVNVYAEPGATVGFNFVPRHVVPNLRADLRFSDNSSSAEYIIWNVEGEWRGLHVPAKESYDTVYVVTVSGTPLVRVSRRRNL